MNQSERLQEQLYWAEVVLESWLHGQPQPYTDFMVTPEVESVRDIGDAINEGMLQLVPVASPVLPGQKLGPPFVLTEDKLKKLERLESALVKLRARKGLSLS